MSFLWLGPVISNGKEVEEEEKVKASANDDCNHRLMIPRDFAGTTCLS